MLGLPKLTETSKQLPKKVIYSKFNLKTVAKEKIDADISRITIVNEVTASKLNVNEGKNINSFFVLNVIMKRKDYNDSSIMTLTKIIPQNLILVLNYKEENKVIINYNKLIQTDWLNKESFKLDLFGLDFDTIWDNIVIQVGDIKLEKENSLKEQIKINEQKEKLLKKIDLLEKKAKKEKQPLKKFEMYQDLQKLKKEMEIL
ncbi:MAG: DUF4391 domain-containing protein [Pleomorphochaeta sp.]